MANNTLASSSWERAQRLLDKNVELENKRQKSAQARVPSDPNAWYQMRENYEAIILEDLSFSDKHDIEYALWLLHYKRIEEFRSHFSAAQGSGRSAASGGARGTMQPDRLAKIRMQFKTFLSEATGFYHDLIVKIRSTYGLPLGLFSENPDNQTIKGKDGDTASDVKKVLISCHRCLIYLGDLARYKGQYGEGESRNRDFAAASSYYLQAASLCPSSGNPHHQLAILASYSGDELVAVYRHFRSLAAEISFPTAKDNLMIVFEKNRQIYSQLLSKRKKIQPADNLISSKRIENQEGETVDFIRKAGSSNEKPSNVKEKYKEFCILFVRLNGILFTRTSLETFTEVLSSVRSALQILLSSGPLEDHSFGTDAADNALAILRLVAVLIFSFSNVIKKTEGQTYAECLQHTALVQNASTMIFELVGLLMGRCLQLQDTSSSFLLPGIAAFLEWLACSPDVATCSDSETKPTVAISLFWENCIALLNKLLLSSLLAAEGEGEETCFTNMSRYDEGENESQFALWEDCELRGFLPLLPAQMILDFSRKPFGGTDGSIKEKITRLKRIVSAGKALTSIAKVDQKPVYYDTKIRQFVAGVEPQLQDDSILSSTLGGTVACASDPEFSKEATLPGVNQTENQPFIEEEEEEEEIVFRPSLTEKLLEATGLKLGPFRDPEPSPNTSLTNRVHFEPMVTGARKEEIGIPSVASSTQQQRHHFNSLDAFHLADERSRAANGLSNLSIMENGHSLMPEMRGLGISAVNSSFPHFQQSVNVMSNGGVYSGYRKGADTSMPSKADPAQYHEVTGETFSGRTLPNSMLSTLKGPTARSVRHLGPPPGFSTVPARPMNMNASLSGPDPRANYRPLGNEQSFFNGYQPPASVNSVGKFSSSNVSHDHLQFMSNHGSFSGTGTGMASFPFPGKQITSMPMQGGNMNYYQQFDNMNQKPEPKFSEQQHMLGTQQFNPSVGQQPGGHTNWTGRYPV